MITIKEYLLSHNKLEHTIYATDDTIHQIVKDELDRLGHSADLNHIDVSQVTNMNSLFSCYPADLGPKYKDLNPDILEWDVSNVTSMTWMFGNCQKFNCDIFSWDVSSVKDMDHMFSGCRKFNKDLSKWDVSNVENMEGMFYDCEIFNGDISNWNTSRVKNMDSMFGRCTKFNQDLSGWNVSNVYYMDDMFNGGCPVKEEYKPKFKD